MSRTADQRDAAIEAIERRDAAWHSFLVATIAGNRETGNREVGLAYDAYLAAEVALARALPI